MIVHVCRTGWPATGGLESSVGGLARTQHAAGRQVRVVTLDRDAWGRELPPGPVDGVPYVRLPRVGPRRYPFARRLRAAVEGASVVHVHGLDGLADVLTHGRRSAPVGLSTHGGYFHTPRHPLLKELCLRTLTRHTMRAADAVWFTSESDRRRLRAAGVPGPVLPDGIDVDRFRRAVRAARPGRWLVVGRVDRHKGLDDLIDALGELSKADPRPFSLEVVGPEQQPGLVAALGERAARLGIGDRVSFLGALHGDALLDTLGRAELAVLPSRYEGFGIAAVELMAARVPLVLSAIPAHLEHAADGAHAVTADFSDRAGAAAALRRARDSDPSGRVEAAARWADRFAWPARLAAWDDAYRTIGWQP